MWIDSTAMQWFVAWCFLQLCLATRAGSSQFSVVRSQIHNKQVGFLWSDNTADGATPPHHDIFDIALFQVFFDRPIIAWNASNEPDGKSIGPHDLRPLVANTLGREQLQGMANFYCGGKHFPDFPANSFGAFHDPPQRDSVTHLRNGLDFVFPVSNEISEDGDAVDVCSSSTYHHRYGRCLLRNLHDMLSQSLESSECLSRSNCLSWGLVLKRTASDSRRGGLSHVNSDSMDLASSCTLVLDRAPRADAVQQNASPTVYVGDEAGKLVSAVVDTWSTRHGVDRSTNNITSAQDATVLDRAIVRRLKTSQPRRRNRQRATNIKQSRLALLDQVRGKVVVEGVNGGNGNSSTVNATNATSGLDMVNFAAFAEVLSDVGNLETVSAGQYFEIIEDPLMNLVVPILINIVVSIVKAPIMQVICMLIGSAIGAVLGPILPLVFLEEDNSDNSTSMWHQDSAPAWIKAVENSVYLNVSAGKRVSNVTADAKPQPRIVPRGPRSTQVHSHPNNTKHDVLMANLSLSRLIDDSLSELGLTPSVVAERLRLIGDERNPSILRAIDASLRRENRRAQKVLDASLGAENYASSSRFPRNVEDVVGGASEVPQQQFREKQASVTSAELRLDPFHDTCSRQTSFQNCLAVGPALPGPFPVRHDFDVVAVGSFFALFVTCCACAPDNKSLLLVCWPRRPECGNTRYVIVRTYSTDR